MEWYEAEVRDLTRRLATKASAAPAVFYGSSTFTLWSTLGEDLRCEKAVNAGFGGSTLEACSYFFERVVAPLHPASLVVYAGDNDLGDGRSPEDIGIFLRALCDQVERHAAGIPFGFVSVKPSPARESILDRIRAANAIIRTEIERRPGGYYVDVFTEMLHEGRARPELFLADGLHLNREGYELWMRVLEPYRDRTCPQAIKAIEPTMGS